MEPLFSLPCSQESVSAPYSELYKSILRILYLVFKKNCNTIFQFTPRFLCSWSLPFRFSIQNLVSLRIFPNQATCPAHFLPIDLIILAKNKNYGIRHYIFFSIRAFSSSPVVLNILSGILFSHTLSLCSSVKSTIQILHRWETKVNCFKLETL
jgi:hypothetical protein